MHFSILNSGFRLLGGEFKHDLQILNLFAEAGQWINLPANVVGFVDDFLRSLLVVPESFAGHLRLKFGEALVQFGHVKETSASA